MEVSREYCWFFYQSFWARNGDEKQEQESRKYEKKIKEFKEASKTKRKKTKKEMVIVRSDSLVRGVKKSVTVCWHDNYDVGLERCFVNVYRVTTSQCCLGIVIYSRQGYASDFTILGA